MKARPYQQGLLEALKDTKEAMAYLEAALEQTIKKDGYLEMLDNEALRDAVKNVIEANKEPEQTMWINVYEANGKLQSGAQFFSKKDADYADDQMRPDRAKEWKREGRLKIKLERRFDDE